MSLTKYKATTRTLKSREAKTGKWTSWIERTAIQEEKPAEFEDGREAMRQASIAAKAGAEVKIEIHNGKYRVHATWPELHEYQAMTFKLAKKLFGDN